LLISVGPVQAKESGLIVSQVQIEMKVTFIFARFALLFR